MIRIFEYLRLILVLIGLCFACYYPAHAALYLVCGVTLPLTGLLALQFFFFPDASADYLDHRSNPYGRYQFGAFFLALFVTAFGVLLMQAGLVACLTIVALTCLVFLFLGVIQLIQFIQEKNASRVHFWRFIGSAMMALVALYAIWWQFQSQFE